MHTLSWGWLSLLSLPLYAKFWDVGINLLLYQFWVKYSNFQKKKKFFFFHTKKKEDYNKVESEEIH